jgi:hypothetical protein
MAFPQYFGWTQTHPSTATTTAPAVTNDASQGYEVGSQWINTTTGTVYVCVDVTIGAAVWKQTSN